MIRTVQAVDSVQLTHRYSSIDIDLDMSKRSSDTRARNSKYAIRSTISVRSMFYSGYSARRLSLTVTNSESTQDVPRPSRAISLPPLLKPRSSLGMLFIIA